MSVPEHEQDRPLRERIAENPRPAAIWGAVFAVLLAAEIGRFAGGVFVVTDVILFLVESVAAIPGGIGGNVSDTLGGPAGTVAAAIASLLILAIAAGPVRGRLPFSPGEKLGLDVPINLRLLVDRAIITVALSVLVALTLLTPFGSLLDVVLGAIASVFDSLSSLQTLTSRETIPNQGHRLPEGGWEGTFLGLTSAQAWALRVVVVYAYAFFFLYWLWRGYLTYRNHYREADWTPFDDSVDRMRGHRWGQFGLVIVIAFVVMAVWAPALGPVTAEENLYQPYQNDVTYLTDDGTVETVTHGAANIDSRSNGASNVGPMSYDEFGRWAPFGTNSDGKDLFTFLMFGARTSLVIGLIAVGLGAGFALMLAMLTSYYKGLVDLVAVLASDTIQSIPLLLLVIILMVVAQAANHPIVEVYDGGILLALILAFGYWPGLWRAIRGPSLQIAEAEWVDAAKSFGQTPGVTMRKHMAPYVFIYMLIYASLILGGIIITTAALSFLGLGINPPTPEWGRMISDGREFVSTKSWHVATIPGVLIVFVVTGFNALGDAIRDALDVESGGGGSETEAAGGGA